MPRLLPTQRLWPQWQERLVHTPPANLILPDPSHTPWLPRLGVWAFMEWRRVGHDQTDDLSASFWQKQHGPLDWSHLESSLLNQPKAALPPSRSGAEPTALGLLALLAYRVQVHLSLRSQTSPLRAREMESRLSHALTHRWENPTEHISAMVSTVRWLLAKPDLSSEEKRCLAGEMMNLWITQKPMSNPLAVHGWESWTRGFAQLPVTVRFGLLDDCLKHEHQVTWSNGTSGGLWPAMPATVAANWYEGYFRLLKDAVAASVPMKPAQVLRHVRLMEHQLATAMSWSMGAGQLVRPAAADHAGPILALLHDQAPDLVPLASMASRYDDVGEMTTARQLFLHVAEHQAAQRHEQAATPPLAPSGRRRVRC